MICANHCSYHIIRIIITVATTNTTVMTDIKSVITTSPYCSTVRDVQSLSTRLPE